MLAGKKLTLWLSEESRGMIPNAPFSGLSRCSERDLRGKLNSARTAPSEEGIADAHIAGRGEPVGSHPTAAGSMPFTPGSAIKLGSSGLAKLGWLKEVEELGAQLQIYPFGDQRRS